MVAETNRVVLVRHARPVIVPESDPGQWVMDASARGDVERLARSIAPLGCDIVVTSDESKARTTGEVLGEVLGLPVWSEADLGEQGAGTIPWIEGAETFRARVIEHFERPGERVFGKETSSEAGARFAGAVSRLAERYRYPVLVTHGRVMSAWIARVTGAEAAAFWRDLRMPDAFAVDIGARRWRRIEEG